MTGISISGPTTVETATIGMDANAVKCNCNRQLKVFASAMKYHGC